MILKIEKNKDLTHQLIIGKSLKANKIDSVSVG